MTFTALYHFVFQLLGCSRQSLKPLFGAAIACCVCASSLVGCGEQGPSEADLSEFGRFIYALDTARMERCLRQTLAADTSHWLAESKVRHRYADESRFADIPLWFTRMGVSADADSLLALLRREVPAGGLDSTAFFVPTIANDLNIVRKLAFDSLGVDINEVLVRLDYHLSKAYVRFTTGMRYGFVRPDKLLNRLEFREERGYLRLFDYEVKAPDYTLSLNALMSDDRMAFAYTSVPQSKVYNQLRERLVTTTDSQQRHTSAVNLERCRWQIAQPAEEGRQVIVNLPAQQLWAISADTILNMRICFGSTATKTPLLHSAITHFNVNPACVLRATPSERRQCRQNNCCRGAFVSVRREEHATRWGASFSVSPMNSPFSFMIRPTALHSSENVEHSRMDAFALRSPLSWRNFCFLMPTSGRWTNCESQWTSLR